MVATDRHIEPQAHRKLARGQRTSTKPMAEVAAAYLLRSQLAVKSSPPLSEEMATLLRPALSTMVIAVTPSALPRAAPLAMELLMLTVPKLVSGRMPPLDVHGGVRMRPLEAHGASTMTSAEDRAALA